MTVQQKLMGNFLTGPDLTNQLIGVLIQFLEEHVAIMADIEAMFNQVKVAGKHRSFLRFLWWEDSDTYKGIVDHKMCVHVFGTVSSPSCSNYALKKTASDNQEEYGNDAAETLRKNFYVDDLLKSDASEEGYGRVSYLRLVDTKNKIHCVFVMGKSRVAPLKFVSIPHLELIAATLSVKMSKLI